MLVLGEEAGNAGLVGGVQVPVAGGDFKVVVDLMAGEGTDGESVAVALRDSRHFRGH